jgi:aspartyl aminopeptidase
MARDLTPDPSLRRAAEARALDLLSFIDRSPTPFQAVVEVERRLALAGFVRLDEREAWTLEAGGRYLVVRGDSSVVAFQLGARAPSEAGLRLVGAHTDSPNLKLKPRAPLSRHGYKQLGVEVYGGVLLSTWLDRDLSLAGRVMVRGERGVEARLVDLGRPLLRVPNLAIHLNREVNTEGLKLNPQQHLPPVYALDEPTSGDLLDAVADAAGVERDAILDHDLSLYDVQRGTISGLDRSFVHAARLDNLACCFAALEALAEAAPVTADATRVIALFDHEEVGSQSLQGAAGNLLVRVVERIALGHPEATGGAERDAVARATARSLLVSADMAHALHPNHADKHEPQHQPVIGRGPVIKTNASQRYATDGEGAAAFTRSCEDAGFSPQAFVTRTDLGCGSTIGPISAAALGVRTVDVGNPMWSMHSCREAAGVVDVELMHRALVRHFAGAR